MLKKSELKKLIRKSKSSFYINNEIYLYSNM